MSKYPLELIEWYDAESDVSWSDPVEVLIWSKKDFVATEVGFVIYEDNHHLVLTSQIGSDGTIGNRTRIPSAWIKSRRNIKANELKGELKGRAKRSADNPDSPGRQDPQDTEPPKSPKRKNK